MIENRKSNEQRSEYKHPKLVISEQYTYTNLETEQREFIADLKSRINFTDLLLEEGFEGSRISDESRFACPFHRHRLGNNFFVWDDVCGGYDFHDECAYDIIEFFKKLRRWDFLTTLRYLAKYVRLELPSSFDLPDPGKRRKNMASQIFEIATGHGLTLFRDQYNEPYACLYLNERREVLRVRSINFRSLISRLVWEQIQIPPSNESLKAVMNIFEAKALYDSPEYRLTSRVARTKDIFWYNLGSGAAVKITEDDWEVVENPPILFRPYAHQKMQVRPEKVTAEWASEILKFLKLPTREQGLLFIIKLATDFVPDIPHPIDILHGPHGSFKTTIQKLKKDLVDPSKVPVTTPSRSRDEFIQNLNKHHNIVFDNQSFLTGEQSDQLCRAVTGDGLSKRKLYTDDDEIIYDIKNCISINGINITATKPDLLHRSLIFSTSTVKLEDRVNEYELWEEFNEVKPKILGGFFSLLSKAMNEYKRVESDWRPRMADFAHWGIAVARALGHTEDAFIKIYTENMQIQNDEALYMNPIAEVILELMANRTRYEDSPTNLMIEIDREALKLRLDMKDRRYPKSPKSLWKRIAEVRANLQEVGIFVDNYKSPQGRRILLEKQSKEK